jgi:hypothetical protein
MKKELSITGWLIVEVLYFSLLLGIYHFFGIAPAILFALTGTNASLARLIRK